MTGKRGVYKARTRKKKNDFILHPKATKAEIEVDLCTAAFDRKVREMDRAWGVDRLVELVDADIAHKYSIALGRLNDAIDAQDPKLVQRRVNDCVRGMSVMHGLAVRSGAVGASDAYWELDVDGFKAAIVADMDAWPAIKEQRPDLELISLREVGIVWNAYREAKAGEMVAAIKGSFPSAQIVRVEKLKDHDDPIPF